MSDNRMTKGASISKIVPNITSCELRKLSFIALRAEVLEVWHLDQQFHQHHLGNETSTRPQTYWISKPGRHGHLFFNAPSLVDSDIHSSLKPSLSFYFTERLQRVSMNALNLRASLCICVFMPLLRKQNRTFHWGSQNNTDSNNVKTTLQTSGSSLSVPSLTSSTWRSIIQSPGLGEVGVTCLPFSVWALRVWIPRSCQLLSSWSAGEQLFHYRNVWFECLRAKDLIYAAM